MGNNSHSTKKDSQKKTIEKSAISSQKKQTKKAIQALHFHRIACVAKVILILSFISLIGIAITGAARALTLETISNKNGIPSHWQVASVGNPDTITLDMTYFDQKMDPCKASERQFEWCGCTSQCAGSLQQGIVKDHLGADGLPIPAYTSHAETSRAGFKTSSQWVTGHDPVVSSDNFYRWYHEVAGLSKRYDRQVVFQRQGNTNTYVYGGSQIFPLDDIRYDNDSVSKRDSNVNSHNFNFTAHMSVPIKAEMNGHETFNFSGDDDVWVYLNGKLVLDIGGLHTAIGGSFTINVDGTITSTVEGVETKLIDAGLEKNHVYDLDFFYAERSTSESNTKITITNMNWPISADALSEGEILDNTLIAYNSSLKNIDPENPLYLTHLSSYYEDEKGNSGFLPLNSSIISYTYTPEIESSWMPLEISAPGTSTNSFRLAYPLTLGKSGASMDTIYFRYNVLPDEKDGKVNNKIAFLTQNNYGDVGISFNSAEVEYVNLEPVNPADDEERQKAEEEERQRLEEEERQRQEEERLRQEEEERQRLEEEQRRLEEEQRRLEEEQQRLEEERQRAEEERLQREEEERQRQEEEERRKQEEAQAIAQQTADQYIPPSYDMSNAAIIDDVDYAYLDPLGVVSYAPNTGIISQVASSFFTSASFGTIILSQGFVIANLAVFALSFAVYYPMRRY